MRVQCAWCKKFSPPKEPLKDDSISHGICPGCARAFATKKNPGEHWHAVKMEEAERSERSVKKSSMKDFYHGKAIAHFESALEERARTKTRKNPLAVFGLGNPPNHVSAKVAGIIYRRCVEVKAEKLGKFQKGFWRHPFDASSQVHVLALDNGDILLHSVAGIRLWERA